MPCPSFINFASLLSLTFILIACPNPVESELNDVSLFVMTDIESGVIQDSGNLLQLDSGSEETIDAGMINDIDSGHQDIADAGHNDIISENKYVLSLSWTNGFCLNYPGNPGCGDYESTSYAAQKFSLHGLWPKPDKYCGVSEEIQTIDEEYQWNQLEVLELSDHTRQSLAEVMYTGYLSFLHRHEWIKHGTCYGTDTNQYFIDSIVLTQEFNNSVIGDFITSHLGQQVNIEDFKVVFDQAFGVNSHTKMNLKCDNENRITDIYINLKGSIEATPNLSDLLVNASENTFSSCEDGLLSVVNP